MKKELLFVLAFHIIRIDNPIESKLCTLIDMFNRKPNKTASVLNSAFL
jgi:hypothetical protein